MQKSMLHHAQMHSSPREYVYEALEDIERRVRVAGRDMQELWELAEVSQPMWSRYKNRKAMLSAEKLVALQRAVETLEAQESNKKSPLSLTIRTRRAATLRIR